MERSQGFAFMLGSLVDKYVASLLDSRGFRRSRLVWNREQAGIVHVLDVQVSRWSDAASVGFTVNLGVWIEELWKICWDKKPPAMIQESECFPRLRVGQLLGNGPLHKDVWWTLAAPEDVDAVGSELQGILVVKCIPFLDKCNSIAAALAAAEDPALRRFPAERVSYAILTHLAGQWDHADRMLSEMLSDPKLKGWHERVRGVARRLTQRSEHP